MIKSTLLQASVLAVVSSLLASCNRYPSQSQPVNCDSNPQSTACPSPKNSHTSTGSSVFIPNSSSSSGSSQGGSSNQGTVSGQNAATGTGQSGTGQSAAEAGRGGFGSFGRGGSSGA